MRELVNLVERLSSRDSMTRYQELSALMEVSAILSRIPFIVRILGGITHYLSLSIPLTLERSKDRLSLVYPP